MISYLESVWLPIDLIIADFCLTVKFCLTFSCNCMVSYMPRCFPTMHSHMVHIKSYVCGVDWLSNYDWLLASYVSTINDHQPNRNRSLNNPVTIHPRFPRKHCHDWLVAPLGDCQGLNTRENRGTPTGETW